MRTLLFGIILILAPHLYANPVIEPTQWTQELLLKTLTVDHNATNDNPNETREGFTFNAWNALRIFLGGYLPIIQKQQLVVHPTFLIEPQIVDSGEVSGIRFWRINTEIALPELNTKVAFSLIVLATTPSSPTPYIIQSISMEKEAKYE